MISKIIKKIFGKKEEPVTNTQDRHTHHPTPDRELTNEEKFINFDLMTDKIFIYHESAYRHQNIIVRRATENNRLTLGEVLSQLFDEKHTSVKSMAIAYRLAELGTDTSERIIENAKEVWNYDLFSCILKRKIDGHYTMGMFHETTLIINCTTNRYIMTLTSLGGIDTVKYMRATLLVPDNKNTDDGMSFKTENAPISISFILSYSELDDNLEFTKYDQVEKDVIRKQEQHKEYDELETEFVHGQFEFQGYEYIGYGKWLFEQNRYYDAFSTLERAFNYIRMNNLDIQNRDLMSVYYDICNIIGQCLSKMDREDEAVYYFKQGAPGLSTEKPNLLASSYSKLGNPTAVDRMNTWINLVAQNYGGFESLPEELKQFSVDVPIELAKYKKRTDDLFMNNPNYNGQITIDSLLRTLIGLNKKNLAPCMFVYDCNSEKFLERVEDIDIILSSVINNSEQQDKVYVLSCNHVHYKTEGDEDQSILCCNAPLIISTHKICGDKTTASMRVDIIRCNFANNDNKREFVRINTPLTYSVCLGMYDNLSFGTDNDNLLAAIRKSIDYTGERRHFEAYKLAKWVFECTSNRLKSPMGINYESQDELLWGIFFEASYRIGFCLMEMNKINTSAYYLEIASQSMQYSHVQEYINFLSNSKDPEVISVVENVMANSPKPENEESLGDWKFHMAFLKRRKAYALIEEERFEEAKTFITNELLNDPQCKDFAQSELNYIDEQLNKR